MFDPSLEEIVVVMVLLNAKKVKYSAATQKPYGRQAPVNKFELISAVDVTSHIR